MSCPLTEDVYVLFRSVIICPNAGLTSTLQKEEPDAKRRSMKLRCIDALRPLRWKGYYSNFADVEMCIPPKEFRAGKALPVFASCCGCYVSDKHSYTASTQTRIKHTNTDSCENKLAFDDELSVLPFDLRLYILTLCGHRSLCTLMQLNRPWKNLVDSSFVTPFGLIFRPTFPSPYKIDAARLLDGANTEMRLKQRPIRSAQCEVLIVSLPLIPRPRFPAWISRERYYSERQRLGVSPGCPTNLGPGCHFYGMLQCFLNGKSWTRALVILNTKPFTTHTSKNTMEGVRIIRDDQYEHQRWVASVGGQWDHFEGKLSDLIHSTAADLDMMANELLLSPYFYSILPVSSS
ncbi:hypothetical protein PROFUN_13110 [Planoprotostelium fungivorum]|uniref:F-box domain-containing protein n=1 Tax=Planoprotostelium fungivorum TaxID=1890364 RepID=A0A2P6N5C8_9EUKA|nr:hypothetical protein PROFUN_13110 [Planoprotostelium fungivorum]